MLIIRISDNHGNKTGTSLIQNPTLQTVLKHVHSPPILTASLCTIFRNIRVDGFNNARCLYAANQWSCVRQRQLSPWHSTFYLTDGSAAQELWEQSVFLFLLTALQINMVRSSPQKRVRLLKQLWNSYLFNWFNYTDYPLKCSFSARNDGSSELACFLQTDESCATVYLEAITPRLVDTTKTPSFTHPGIAQFFCL